MVTVKKCAILRLLCGLFCENNRSYSSAPTTNNRLSRKRAKRNM
jgi:hypothetical protein